MVDRDPRYRYPHIQPDVVDPIAIKRNPWYPEEILNKPHEIIAPKEDYDEKRMILYHDMVSEYDARIFGAYVHSLSIPLSPEFGPADELWQIDEDNHYKGFRIINRAIFGLTDQDIEKIYNRQGNFEPLKHLLSDELRICLTVAYDELCTVRAYRGDLPIYDAMGPSVGKFVRRVIGDEGWHYSKFLRLVKRYHPDEIAKALEIVNQIRAAEGLPYQQTFVMDHIEDVFTTKLFDEAENVLKKNLLK
ncbi:hypothetical protein HYV22_02190 [Candidatus Gottesmanbacteria bacterium]|nr:hypothetical protein [Candidatus Gottesmanbacteria bacterium]